jgi:hypothetical protein
MGAAGADFFAAEPLLVARLQSIAAAGVKVLTAPDLAGTAENAQHMPAYQVIFGGYRVVDDNAQGALPLIEQRWFIVTAVRNAASQISGAAGRQNANALMDAALHALLGWKPSNDLSRLQLGTGGSPTFRKGGYAYYPLMFTTRLKLKGESITARGIS